LYITDILLGLAALSNTACILLIVLYLKRTTPLVSPISAEEHVDQHFDELGIGEQLTLQEHIILREEAYDQRIAKFKDELANQFSSKYSSESDAPEFDPNVKNLPHKIIDNKGANQGIEVSE
jgi:hypothetical protein